MSDQLLSIRRTLLPCQGRAIRLYVHKERNQILDIKGVLEGVYAGVFTVYAQSGGYGRRYCYSYRDILTKSVRILPLPSQVPGQWKGAARPHPERAANSPARPPLPDSFQTP